MKEHVYFDNAATTWPKPEGVYTFMDSFFRSHGVNPGRGGYALSIETEQMINATRSLLAQFFGFTGDTQRVVFTLNGTDALNIALNGLLQTGDHVVSTRVEHNAVLRTLNHWSRDRGIQTTLVAADATGSVDPEEIRSALKKNTRAVVLNHASNVHGTIQRLDAIAEIIHDHPAKLILDTAQTGGVVPISMSDRGIDILTFTGHKGLFGPTGIGGLIVGEGVTLQPSRFGGTGVDSISEFQPEGYPHRLEAGTPSLPGIAGLHAAQLWFRELGHSLCSGSENPETMSRQQICHKAVRHIHAVEMQHLDRIRKYLVQIPSVNLMGSAAAEKQVATLSFTVSGMPSQQVADMLDADYHVCVRAGLHCAPLVHLDSNTVENGGAVRIAPGFFTDEYDIQQLLLALDNVC